MIEYPLRTRVYLNSGWEFTLGKVGRKWMRGDGPLAEAVDLPHCWNTDDTYQYGRSSYAGHGAYRRWFELPEMDTAGTWHLCSHGFYGRGEVWLDDRPLTTFDGQYLGLDVPIPPTLAAGSHRLSIRLDNRAHRNVLPGKKAPDFLLYGGLAGGAWLEFRPAIRVEERGVEVVCETQDDGSEAIEFRATVTGSGGQADGRLLRWRIVDEEDRAVAWAETVVCGGSVTTPVVIADPRCWSPNHPHLYRAEGQLVIDSESTDRVELRFGVTRAEFRSDEGFFLDGVRVDLHGANRHESIPGLGSVPIPELQRADAQHLKRLGANFVRCSHYPQHPAFLDACDELGILVYAEIATWKSVRSSRGWRRAARRQMRDLILRDRHRPSVILWGMGNESRSRRAYLELRDLARQLDPTRPVTYAENHLYRARRQKTIGVPDVWGVNYELDVLDDAREAAAGRVVVISECCNHPTSVRGDELEELRQLAVIEREWEIIADRAFVAGHAVWSFTDYATEYRRRTRRQTGLCDAWRRPKMAAELFRARYAREPFISLICVRSRLGAPASRFRTEVADPLGGGSPFRLHVFSNCEGIRILQNGAPLASMDPIPHGIVPVDLERGEITAEGFGRGTAVTAAVRAWGPAAAVKLRRSTEFPLIGGLTVIDLSIVDESGTTVPTWHGQAKASGTGGASVLGYTQTGEVLVSRGEGRLFVSSGPEAVAPTVAVDVDGLESGRLILGAADETDPTDNED